MIFFFIQNTGSGWLVPGFLIASMSRQGNNYTIRDDVISGKETVAHVSQIARMRSPVGPEESEEVPALTQNDEQVWDRLKEGTYCIIWLKTEEKSILRVLEVLEVVDGQQLIGWHYIHRAQGAFNPELPLAQRRLMPEWAQLLMPVAITSGQA